MGKLGLVSFIFLFTAKAAIAATPDYSLLIEKQAQQIKNLTGRLELLENSVFDLKTQLKSQNSSEAPVISAPPSPPVPAVPLEVAPPSNPDQVLSATEKPAIGQDKKEYDVALAALKDNKFEEAEGLLSEFMEKYPNSSLQSNAMFWYGETFFRRGMFKESAINYLKGYKAHPKGAKAADSLLKLSFSLASLNKKQEACNMLSKLETEFPNRPDTSVKRAKDARMKFGCK